MKPRANQQLRTRRALLEAAGRLIAQGRVPTMEEVAAAALVSRPTAYRYFRSVDALLNEAVVDAAVSASVEAAVEAGQDPEERLLAAEAALHRSTWDHEAALRVMLAHAVQRDPADESVPPRQNRRLPLIESALAPVRESLGEECFRRLSAALALIFGTEAMIVFRDVLRIDEASSREVKAWAIRTLLRGALTDSAALSAVEPVNVSAAVQP
jgi:AcrR family transcriptional regulator